MASEIPSNPKEYQGFCSFRTQMGAHLGGPVDPGMNPKWDPKCPQMIQKLRDSGPSILGAVTL